MKLKSLVLMAVMACFPAFAASDSITDEQLQDAIEAKLAEQLQNKDVAAYTAEFLMNEILTWQGEPLPLDQADSILAYAFGNRVAPNGNQEPGPMNEALADVVVDIHKKTGKPVYAQWEIAQSIGDRIAPEYLTSINPQIGADGTIVYLSTIGVADEVVKQAGGVDKLGKTVVVGFYVHSLRTISTSRDAGIDAYAPEGIALPYDYDPESGQAWTRDAQTFVMHEIRNRATNERTRLINEQLEK
ncbi:hypothetical protein MD588_21825 [Photobacterium sp. SDRW27]|uniref:hypothetical protein n=1 Tax=Photobacterium obscurum TaxID=2829490 RepID=UPI00224493EF|nr:hypothetical protein [Photobacterium obscurum]MCW8331437.1 hypothetical protein [Photobacterium obscurum]